MSQPLIEERRVRFSGLSSESFADLERGEKVTFTVVATCTATAEQDMKTEGERLTATMKVDKVSLGIDPKINDEPAPEPSLFDSEPADDPDEPEDDGEGQGDEADNAAADDEGASVSSIGTGFSGGPQFSAGDGE
ncbi:hypothetical protein GS453_14675 [Rhodococcus hoagii]|uniref:Uncharacterized protein n=1 Tax=Rhodococcus hoagii TaxID=43767 RepID=A0AAP2ALL0_RHOHA|nr:hypothetical protein [Prescottella equi]MBM4628058.1 hypothetical protein [Prescottella equi]